MVNSHKKYHLLLDGTFLIVAGFFLFARLGHYALWDDEALTALASRGILESGDTRAINGHNIFAYRSGLLLNNLCDRSTPPLTSYLVAPSIWLFGDTSFAARFPCAILGMALAVLVVFFLGKLKVTNIQRLTWYLAISGNISLFLFLRQSRYYAPSILLVVLILLFYFFWNRKENKNLIWTIILFGALFSANYMACLALFVALAADYLIWKRKTTPLPLKAVLPWIVGSLSFCFLISRVWNPFQTGFGLYAQENSWKERLILFFWNWRDAADCQFSTAGLLLAGLFVGVLKNDPWLKRGWAILFTFTAVITSVSPQLVAGASVADVRYMAPMIPLGIALSVRSFLLGFSPRFLPALILGLSLFWTNLGSGAFLGIRPLRCLPWEFLQELITPPPEPYSVAAQWISNHAPPGATVWVLPDYACYPLMFHAPNGIYAWQLMPEQRQEEQFKNLPDIHFQGLVPPDFIVVFGPSVEQVRQLIGQWSMQGLRYQEVTRLMTFWKDLYRPELFWRTFKPIEKFDPNTEAIYIFQRQP